MSKLTDFYIHRESFLEKGEPIDPQWELLEDQLLKEELLPELIEQLKSVLSKVKSPLMFNGSYDPNGCLSVSFTRNCIQFSTLSASQTVVQGVPGIAEDKGEVEPERPEKKPVLNEEATQWNYPIKEQFRSFLSRKKAPKTVNSYTSTLDNAVKMWINKKVDEHADSVFSYTSSEDVRLCIDILNASADYVAENSRKHYSMSAALNQFLLFIEEWEKRV